MLSHNHGLPFVKCSELLDQWLKANKIHAGKISCSYFVQYIDETGNAAVTTASFDRLKSLKSNQKNKKVTGTLFGISLTTTNRTTGLKESFDNLHIPIKAKYQLRNIAQRPVPPPVTEPKIHIKSEKVTNAGTKNISNMFEKGSTSKDVKKEVVETKNSPMKKGAGEKKSPVNKKVTPKKSSKSVTVTASQGKIASFFSKAQAKPSTKPVVKPGPEVQKVVEEPGSSKRFSSLIDTDDDEEVVPGTPQEKRGRKAPVKEKLKETKTKKAPPKMSQSKQHSRIAVIEDSSESEVEEERDLKRKEQKIELNISDSEDRETTKTPEKKSKPEVKTETKSATGAKRRTGVRQVIRKYQDENGFMGKSYKFNRTTSQYQYFS